MKRYQTALIDRGFPSRYEYNYLPFAHFLAPGRHSKELIHAFYNLLLYLLHISTITPQSERWILDKKYADTQACQCTQDNIPVADLRPIQLRQTRKHSRSIHCYKVVILFSLQAFLIAHYLVSSLHFHSFLLTRYAATREQHHCKPPNSQPHQIAIKNLDNLESYVLLGIYLIIMTIIREAFSTHLAYCSVSRYSHYSSQFPLPSVTHTKKTAVITITVYKPAHSLQPFVVSKHAWCRIPYLAAWWPSWLY